MRTPILVVCRKEVLENGRDRRTVFSTLFFGPLFAPALFAVLINVMLSQALSSMDEVMELPIIGAEHAPNLVGFLRRYGLEPADDGPASLEDARAAVARGQHDIALAVAPDYAQAFRNGDDARVTLIVDRSETGATAASQRVRTVLDAYANQIGMLRLQARGLNPAVLRAVTIDELDVSTAAARSVLLLGMLTYFLLLATLAGGFYLAIDATAGERERGSLEPLLTVPVGRSSLLLGKMAATICYMLLSLALTLFGFMIALKFVPLESLGMRANFDAAVALQTFLLLAPFTPLGAALMTLVASFTRSYKEAQTYLTLVLLIPTLPLLLASLLNVEPDFRLMWIPSLSQHLLVTALLKAEPLSWSYAAVSATASVVLGALLALLAIRLYDREALLG
ncbi:MAG: ABC transporter permease subunit [Gammaproteobacteria bacterium]|nr:ABC transporter permease subunit [Gammaproteobacteria bacterium]MDH3506437.1 ABC transporter permease subunit [Gammaproteobacteria bacterium]